MKLYEVVVRGKYKTWGFEVMAEPEYVEEWRQDGLQVDEIENIVPQEWWALGLSIKFWCFLQDLWSFRNPFRRH